MSLEIRNLDVVYGNGGHSIQALENIDLTIDRGQ
ncbi:MAG TPA: macrolide ABC transporter ATP-binding protein, partial [Deltaproteobacteria bacterium]|nr:macrolide ABC transporter ATP-binding protein [Deltaproteobacteria bacterium]